MSARRLFAAALATAAIVTAAAQLPALAVIGGRPANPDRWSFTVALRQNVKGPEGTRKVFFCTGSLIAPTVVLTAAHCVRHKGYRRMRVIAGRERVRAGETGQVLKVRQVRRFPTYRENQRHDIAVLLLAKPARYEPVELATAAEANRLTRVGSKLFVAGYGDTHPLYTEPGRYGHLTVGVERIRPYRRCRLIYGRAIFRAESMLCSLGRIYGRRKIGSTTCSGDSGGPIVAWTSRGFVQVGVTSFGGGYGNVACGAVGVPSVYARASRGMSFIARPLAEALGEPPAQ